MRHHGYIAVALALGVAAAEARPGLAVPAPFEVVQSTDGVPAGLAVAPDGSVFVSDSIRGVLHRIDRSGVVAEVARDLDEPWGLVSDADGAVLVVERRAGRVLRVDRRGDVSVIAEGLRRPEWIAVAGDGTILVTVDGRSIVAIDDQRPRVVASRLDEVGGITWRDDALWAVTARHVLRLTAAGDLGVVGHGLRGGTGLAADALGSLYVTATSIGSGREGRRGTVGRLGPDGSLGVVAAGLRRPLGLAFGPDGSLYVADGDRHVLRWRPPAPPALADLPANTNRRSITIAGHAEPGSRVDVVTSHGVTAVAEATSSGAFRVVVDLGLDADNVIQAFATSHRGAGLTSLPASARILQDSQPPTVGFLRPPTRRAHRGIVAVEVEARDPGSGVDHVALHADQFRLGHGSVASWDTRSVADGWHTLSASATDRAGNRGRVSRAVLVDNTPPDTSLGEGAPPEGPSTSVAFRVEGTDNLTPPGALRFAWRLDGGVVQDLGEPGMLVVPDLAAGEHVVEAWAIDRAGNRDPSPATRRFRVGVAPAITIASPAPGAVLAPGPVLVQGTVRAAGDVGVVVNGAPAVVEGGDFAALVPVVRETTALVAVATSGTHVASATVAVSVGDDAAPLIVDVAPRSGLAPLTVTFTVRGPLGFGRLELDADGDGRADVTTTDSTLAHTYGRPGAYVARLRADDGAGGGASATTLVHVLDDAAFEAARQATWQDLRAALARSDVAAALGAFVVTSRSRYEAALTVLVPDLPRIAREMDDLSLVSAESGVAELATTRVHDGARRLYFVYFVQDGDGRWRILAM